MSDITSDLLVFQGTSTTNSSKQELNDLLEIIKLKRKKYNENKILCEVARTCSKSVNVLNTRVKSKIYNILLSADVELCMQLQSWGTQASSSTLLGLTSFANAGLTYNECNELKDVLERQLILKCEMLIKDFNVITERNFETVLQVFNFERTLALSIDDRVAFDFKRDLNTQQELYVENLQQYAKILEEMVRLRTEMLPTATNMKLQECATKAHMYHLRAKLVRESTRMDIFSETSSSLGAYKEIYKDIVNSQKQCELEVEQLRELNEKYKQVLCKQYNEILKSYLQFKAEIAKRSLLYDQISR